MTIVTEKNYLEKTNNLKVLRTETYIPDEEYNDKMKKIYALAKKKKREKLAKLTSERQALVLLIGGQQKLALTLLDTPDEKPFSKQNEQEANRLFNYVTEVLKPKLTGLNREIKALELSLAK